ncbi:MAG: TonB-dependent siderophore receptor [Agriterribacter sp.]
MQNILSEVVVTGVKSRRYTQATSDFALRSNANLKDVPQAIQVIPRQVLADQNVYRLSDVYKNVAGVTEQSDFNYVNMRGFLTSSANFMINGQRGSYFGLASSPQIPYAEKVEVLKGPSSVLFGNGAIGGTINIITKKPKKDFATSANITAGSFGLLRVQADVTGSLNRSKTLSALLNIGAETGGSFYKDFKNNSVTITPVVSWNISPKTELTSTTIIQVYNQTSPSSGLPVIGTNNLFAVPVSFRYAGDDSKFNAHSIQEQLSLKHDFNDKLSANIWLSIANRKTDASFYQPGGYSPRTDSITRIKSFYEGNLKGYGINAFVSYKARTGKVAHLITAGIDYNNAAEYYPKGEKYWYALVIDINHPNYAAFNTAGITPDYYDADNEKYGPTRSAGIYLQDQVSLSEKWKALLAIRYDDYLNRSYFLISGSEYFDSSKAHAFIPKIGLVYQPVQSVSVYGSYSEGFQPQYSNSRASGGPFPPLKARQVEAGFKGAFFQKRLVPTLTWYVIRQANVLKPDPSDATGVRQVTTGEVTSRGIEITLTGNLTKQWNVLANYAHNKIFISKSTVAGEKGTGFGDTPSDAFSLWTTYQLNGKLKGLKAGAGYRQATKRSVYGLELPGYSVWDAVLSYQYNKIGLAVNAFNLADKRYAIGSFGTSYYFPGVPRSVQVSLNYNW